jgi:hypothetical protein
MAVNLIRDGTLFILITLIVKIVVVSTTVPDAIFPSLLPILTAQNCNITAIAGT